MNTVFYVSYMALWALLLAQSLLILLLYRHFGLSALGTLEGVQRDGLKVGEQAPGMNGSTGNNRDLRWRPETGTSYLLAFVSPDCDPCAKIMPYLNWLAQAGNLGDKPEIVGVVSGDIANLARFDQLYRPSFSHFADDGHDAFGGYMVRVTPFAFVIGQDGRVLAKGLCSDPGKLRGLLHASGFEEAAAVVNALDEGPIAAPMMPTIA